MARHLAVVAVPDTSTPLPELAVYADRVSRRLEETANRIHAASASGSVAQRDAVVSNLTKAVDALDDITAAARERDRDRITDRIATLNSALSALSASAKSLKVPACALEPLLTPFATTTTTEPPEVTLSPDTVPLDTNSAPATSEATTADQRQVSIAASLASTADTSFTDITDSMAQHWLDTVNSTDMGPSTAGEYGGVEVTDSFGNTYARVFEFRGDARLNAALGTGLLKVLAGTATVRNASIGTYLGSAYQVTGEGSYFFSVLADGRTILWAVSPTADGLVTAVRAFQGAS